MIDAPDGPEEAGRHAFAGRHGVGRARRRPDRPRGPRDRLPARRPGRLARPAAARASATACGASPLAFADIFERAVLRRRLRVQRQELRQVASWADARTSELSDGAIDLAVERDAPGGDEPGRGAGGGDAALRDLLTRRELDVLEHMVQGETNADIARALVVSEGTVKFHVKNILRKLHASNRAEATSRYLRLSLRHGEGDGARSLP